MNEQAQTVLISINKEGSTGENHGRFLYKIKNHLQLFEPRLINSTSSPQKKITLPQKAHYIAVFLLRLRPFTSITSSLCQNFTNATSKTWIHLGPVWNACNVTSKVRIQLYFGSVCIAGIFFSISTFFLWSIILKVSLLVCD